MNKRSTFGSETHSSWYSFIRHFAFNLKSPLIRKNKKSSIKSNKKVLENKIINANISKHQPPHHQHHHHPHPTPSFNSRSPIRTPPTIRQPIPPRRMKLDDKRLSFRAFRALLHKVLGIDDGCEPAFCGEMGVVGEGGVGWG